MFFILKPFLALYNEVKVLAMASTLIDVLVRNFAAIAKSLTHSLLVRQQPNPSLSKRVRRFHDCAKSSISYLDFSPDYYFPKPSKKGKKKTQQTKKYTCYFKIINNPFLRRDH